MTNEEAIAIIRREYLCVDRDCDIEKSCGRCDLMMPSKEPLLEAYKMAMDALEQEQSGDLISRQAVLDLCDKSTKYDIPYEYYEGKKHIRGWDIGRIINMNKLIELPSVNPQERAGRCKDCKYFEYDSVAKVDGIPLIVAHEICSRWGDGCKTSEDGYCFLFKPQERSEE